MEHLLGLTDLYLSYNWCPIPTRGKIPVVPQWQKITHNKARDIIKKQIELHRCSSVGLLCGEISNIVVVDIDVQDQGLELWENLLEDNKEPESFKVKTPSGGFHYYFSYDEKTALLKNSNKSIGGYGLDLRTSGGQLIGPGNVFSKGSYIPISGVSEEGIPIISSMPEWLFKLYYEHQK